MIYKPIPVITLQIVTTKNSKFRKYLTSSLIRKGYWSIFEYLTLRNKLEGIKP